MAPADGCERACRAIVVIRAGTGRGVTQPCAHGLGQQLVAIRSAACAGLALRGVSNARVRAM